MATPVALRPWGSSLDCASSATSVSAFAEEVCPRGMRMRGERGSQLAGAALLHAAAEDLVGRDQHDADDEGHGEGADEALADAGLSVLFLGVHWGGGGVGRQRARRRGERWRGGGEKREMTP